MDFVDRFKSSFIMIFFLGYIFLISGIIVNFFQLCSCILWPFDKALFRKVNCYLALLLWSQFTFLSQWWSNSDCILYMTKEDHNRIAHEHTLVIMNHKYDIDWLFAWMMCQRLGMLKGSKIVAKQALKFVPILGWCWCCTETIFVKRVWERDRETLTKDLRSTLANYPRNHFFNLMISCEGTRFTEAKRLASMEIAQEKGLPELKHHLLPRTKGFILLLQGSENRINAVYDITVGFKKIGAKPTLLNILKGRACQAEMYIRRIPTSEIPTDTEGANLWVHELYRQKDAVFDYFVQHDTFQGHSLPPIKEPRNYYDLLIVLGWSIIIGIPSMIYFMYLFWTSSLITQLIFVIVVSSVSFGVRAMIAVTETERGSHYGICQACKMIQNDIHQH